MSGYPNTGAGLKIATVNLTSAQVLALFTTPVQILPAPGPGIIYIPIAATFNYHFGGTAYTDGGGNIGIFVGSLGLIQDPTAGWWDQASSQVMFKPTGILGSLTEISWANQAMFLEHTVANPTLGNGTVAVSVAYYLMKVS